MTSLKDPSGGTTTYGYDNDNRKTSIAYPNGTGMVMGYDAAGRTTQINGGKTSGSGSSLQITTYYVKYTYTYSLSNGTTNLIQSETAQDPTNVSNHFSWAYGYDSQNRLTSAVKTDQATKTVNQQWSVVYDANGNMTRKTYSGASDFIATYGTFNADNEPTSATSTGHYGGQSISGGDTYSYDADGNLLSVVNTGNTSSALSHPQTHVYNAANQDVSGKGTAHGGTEGSYRYGYSGTDQTERVNNNGVSDVYTGLGLSSETTSSGTTEYVRCSCGMLNSERTPDGKIYYYLFDIHGSIVGMTDSSGNDVNRYGYYYSDT
jgi:YD repeat-containing protein